MKRVLLLLAVWLTSSSQAALIYNNTTPVPLGAYHNLDAGATMLDDVLIPLARMSGNNQLIVRRVTFQLFSPVGGTYNVMPVYADGSIVNNALTPVLPPISLTNQVVTMDPNQTKLVTIGNGTDPLFTVNTIQPGAAPFQAFFFGLRFVSPSAYIGWVHANGPDANVNAFYGYYGPGDSRNGEKQTAGFQASFYIEMNGDPVPEPQSVLAVGLGTLLVLSKRFRRRP